MKVFSFIFSILIFSTTMTLVNVITNITYSRKYNNPHINYRIKTLDSEIIRVESQLDVLITLERKAQNFDEIKTAQFMKQAQDMLIKKSLDLSVYKQWLQDHDEHYYKEKTFNYIKNIFFSKYRKWPADKFGDDSICDGEMYFGGVGILYDDDTNKITQIMEDSPISSFLKEGDHIVGFFHDGSFYTNLISLSGEVGSPVTIVYRDDNLKFHEKTINRKIVCSNHIQEIDGISR